MLEVEFAGRNLENSSELADWRHPSELIEMDDELPAASAGVEALRMVLAEVFKSRQGKLDVSSAFNRFLSLTWVVRPDLLDGRSLTALGEEAGVTRACLSKLAVKWTDMLDGYRNGGQKSAEARKAYKAAQEGHDNYRARADRNQPNKNEQRLARLLTDFKAGKAWRRIDKEFLRRRGLIGAGDQLTAKGRAWVGTLPPPLRRGPRNVS